MRLLGTFALVTGLFLDTGLFLNTGLFLSAGLTAAAADPREASDGRYGFRAAKPEALARYRRGWVAILEYGRWGEAERLYRQTVALDPDFAVAKSVLARITLDPAERQALYRAVEDVLPAAPADDRLLLNTYQKTLELFARREAGEAIDPGFRRTMAENAVRDYGEFLNRYPREWSVMIEYLEWVHALEGPEAALGEMDRLRAKLGPDVSFSYFEAAFHAELGEHEEARRLADAFEARLGDPTSPQPPYLDAYLLYEAGDLEAAAGAVERALALDPRHLIAERLRDAIEDAVTP